MLPDVFVRLPDGVDVELVRIEDLQEVGVGLVEIWFNARAFHHQVLQKKWWL